MSSDASKSLDKDLELEMDALNQNPAMPVFLKLLMHLHTTVSPPKAGDKMPSWMQELYDKMSSPDTHINIRLFIAKLIINRPQVFEPFGEHWWKPLSLLIVDSPSFGSGINYFVQDLCVLLLTWAGKSTEPSQGDKSNWPPVVPSSANEEDVRISSRLIAFLMANTYHPTSFVMRNNLELVKGFLENWGAHVVIPTAVICDQFSRTTEKEEKENLVGIQLLGVVLANNLPPYG
jgi:DNA-dependent protein kinase catalytic subunit